MSYCFTDRYAAACRGVVHYEFIRREFIMLQILSDTIEDLHPITVHFPIALLVVSAGSSVVLRFKHIANLRETSWLLLWIGTLGALVASVTGVISHFEATDLHDVIETHQMWSFCRHCFFHCSDNLALAFSRAGN